MHEVELDLDLQVNNQTDHQVTLILNCQKIGRYAAEVPGCIVSRFRFKVKADYETQLQV